MSNTKTVYPIGIYYVKPSRSVRKNCKVPMTDSQKEYNYFYNVYKNPSRKHIKKYLLNDNHIVYKEKIILKNFESLSKDILLPCYFMSFSKDLKNIIKERLKELENEN